MNRILIALFLVFLPVVCLSTTAPDLSYRIRIDGHVSEYEPDEWVLDSTTVFFKESSHDSRWGAGNDISRIAVTWDDHFLYIAVEGVFHSSALMAFLEYGANGAGDLVSAGPLRRNILFSGISPNMVIQADRGALDAAVATVTVLDPPQYLDRGDYESHFFQPSRDLGALEIALPWTLVRSNIGYLKLLAIVTAGVGSGAGDAAPDPSAQLSWYQQAQVRLDNAIEIPVDNNHDGYPDMGVSPRSVASFSFRQAEPVRGDLDIDLHLERTSFSPDLSQTLPFRVSSSAGADPVRQFVTCEVYSVSGTRVRALFQDQEWIFRTGGIPLSGEWDGRDDAGEIVRGGIYIVSVTSGASPGARTSSAKQSAAVIR
jgi:hypothetical protein